MAQGKNDPMLFLDSFMCVLGSDSLQYKGKVGLKFGTDWKRISYCDFQELISWSLEHKDAINQRAGNEIAERSKIKI